MNLWAFLAFVAFISASPLQKRLGTNQLSLGFRAVSPEEATMITENMKKLIESNGSGGQQTGAGTYISPELESGWGEDDDWDCGIFVDPDAWDAQNKAWMPESWVSPPAEGEEEDGGECLNLWWEGDDENFNRELYLKTLDPSFTPDNTVIFSEIDDENGDEQIMIPTAMVLSLDNHVECAKRGEDAYHNVLQLPGNADWNFANIKGSPT